MTDKERTRIESAISYVNDFQQILLDVVGNALALDQIIAPAKMWALYSIPEITAAARAAHAVGLPVHEGVGYFVLLSALGHNETQRNRSFFHKMLTKLPPRSGSPMFNHLSIVNYAMPRLMNGQEVDEEIGARFARQYAENLMETSP